MSYKEKLKAESKQYIEELYRSHRGEDIDSWSHLIDVIFMYIDLSIEEHERCCLDDKDLDQQL